MALWSSKMSVSRRSPRESALPLLLTLSNLFFRVEYIVESRYVDNEYSGSIN